MRYGTTALNRCSGLILHIDSEDKGVNEMVTPGGKQNRGMYDVNGQVLFVDKGVAKALNYKDSSDALKRHVENEDKLSRRITDSGQRRKT